MQGPSGRFLLVGSSALDPLRFRRDFPFGKVEKTEFPQKGRRTGIEDGKRAGRAGDLGFQRDMAVAVENEVATANEPLDEVLSELQLSRN